MSKERPRIAVLVDLERTAQAGGHVKTWERLAEAAARADHGIDLTVHVQGEDRIETVSPHVRFMSHQPAFSTRRLPFLSGISDHTNLAPFHARLAGALRATDVIHTTDAYFAFARTATRVARWRGVPLVTSLHTETPALTRVYTEKVIHRVFGEGRFARLLIDRLRLPQRQSAKMDRRLTRHARAAAMVWVGEGADLDAARARFGPRVATLRRGIDRTRFSPARRDRVALAREFGIAGDSFVLFCCGRIEAGKSPLILARAARALIEQGRDVHLLMAGEGNEAAAVRALLGDRVHLPGNLPQDRLAVLYASCDLFVFPSAVEIAPNVVIEAQSCGLPVIVAPQGGGKFVRENGRDGIVIADREPEAWARAIAAAMDEPERRARLAQGGIEAAARYPTWDDVLARDLVPIWRRLA